MQGWYIVTYALAIYHLNLFLAFLTPKIDPAMSEMDGDEGETYFSSNLRGTDEMIIHFFIPLVSQCLDRYDIHKQ